MIPIRPSPDRLIEASRPRPQPEAEAPLTPLQAILGLILGLALGALFFPALTGVQVVLSLLFGEGQ